MIKNVEDNMKSITVGMPIYNNANTLSKAIESVRSQLGIDLKIILSDDGSTDNSWEVCQQYASIDKRITAVKQPSNLYYNNFKFVLDEADTPYFCWLAGDDYFAEGFLEKAIEVLEQQTDAVAAMGECWFYKNGECIDKANGSYAIMHDSKEDRLVEYLSASTDNSRMYGVLRTHAAQQSFPTRLFYAYDYAFSALTLAFGKHVHIGGVSIYRDKTDAQAYRHMVRKDAKNTLTRLFPLYLMTWYLIKNKHININWPIFKKLSMLNFNYHLNYCEVFHPKYHKFVVKMMNQYTRQIGWRFKKRI